MLHVPPFPQTETNARLFQAIVTWAEDGEMLRQEHFICARSKEDAEIIAHNRAPIRLTRNDKPQPGDKINIKISDYGEPLPNRTYYTSPIMDSSYSPVKPGPMKRRKIKDFDEEIEQKTPVVQTTEKLQTEPEPQLTNTVSSPPETIPLPQVDEPLAPNFADEDIDLPSEQDDLQETQQASENVTSNNFASEDQAIQTDTTFEETEISESDQNQKDTSDTIDSSEETESESIQEPANVISETNKEIQNVLAQLACLYGMEISKIIEDHTNIGTFEKQKIQELQATPDIYEALIQFAETYVTRPEIQKQFDLTGWFHAFIQTMLTQKENQNEKENS